MNTTIKSIAATVAVGASGVHLGAGIVFASPIVIPVAILGGTAVLISLITTAGKVMKTQIPMEGTIPKGDAAIVKLEMNDDNKLLKATATPVSKREAKIITKDQINITENVTVNKTISVNIDILNHKEIVKHHKGWFTGTLINWMFPEKAKQEVNAKVTEKLNTELKSGIEKEIAGLASRLGEEITQAIMVKLSEVKIKATVITTVN